jgi:type IX secretion system PorP/SprF family membrane protein
MSFFKKIFAGWCLLLVGHAAFAQNIQYSQFHHSPLLLNPAAVAAKSELLAMFNYRTQLTQTGQSYSTPMLSLVMPFINNRERDNAAFGKMQHIHRWGGVGISVLQDVEKGSDQTKLRTTGGHLTYAHNLDIGGTSYLSFGMQMGYFNRSLETDLVTESQFVYGGADPSLPANEDFVGSSINFATFSAGMMVYSEDQHGRFKNYFSLAAYNFNQPNVTFFERAANQNTDALPVRMVAAAGVRVYDNGRFTVLPKVRWIQQRSSSQVNVGVLTKIHPKEDDPHTSIGVGAWYSVDNAAIISFEYYNPHFILGLSYDLRFGSNLALGEGNGIPEISLAFRKLIEPTKKKKRKIRRKKRKKTSAGKGEKRGK